jgi:hypothetical protein
MVTGAVASIIYGEPRFTNDIDLVVDMSSGDIAAFTKIFPPHAFYCPPPDVLEEETRRPVRGHFNIIHQATGFKADIYTVGRDELHHWAMSKRRRIEMQGECVWVAPPEYVIIRKLEYFKEGGPDKHLRDIESILEVTGDELDTEAIHKRTSGLGLEKEWDRVLRRFEND